MQPTHLGGQSTNVDDIDVAKREEMSNEPIDARPYVDVTRRRSEVDLARRPEVSKEVLTRRRSGVLGGVAERREQLNQ
jgi:hypothetical protein